MITKYVCPPIPIRQFDWCAYLDCGEYDAESGPYGHGRTEAEAIIDLEDLLNED